MWDIFVDMWDIFVIKVWFDCRRSVHTVIRKRAKLKLDSVEAPADFLPSSFHEVKNNVLLIFLHLLICWQLRILQQHRCLFCYCGSAHTVNVSLVFYYFPKSLTSNYILSSAKNCMFLPGLMSAWCRHGGDVSHEPGIHYTSGPCVSKFIMIAHSRV